MKPTATITLKKSHSRSRVPFLVSSIGAVVLVVLGWALTVASAIHEQVQTASVSVYESATQAREQLREASKEAQPVSDRVGSIRDQFSESMKIAEEIKASETFILEHIKQQIEAEKTESYAKEARTQP